ncbi:MAG TPA: hypothetical protein VGK19_11775 [Capsulimonadaceae bacterium]
MNRALCLVLALAASPLLISGCGGTVTSSSVVTSGPTTPVVAGQTVQLSSFLTGASSFTSVTYAIETNSSGAPTGVGGSVTVDGKYTAPSVLPLSGSHTQVIVVTSKADPSKVGTVTVTVGYAVSSISPSGSELSVNRSVTFAATVAGDPASTSVSDTRARINWTVTGAGSIDAATGKYTAPVTAPDGTLVTITATSTADPTVSASTTLKLRSAGGTVVII